LGLEGAVTEARTPTQAKKSLESVLQTYVSMLCADDSVQSAELEYLSRLTVPPKGVDWIRMPLVAAKKRRTKRSRVHLRKKRLWNLRSRFFVLV
jgi:hypothetical protein